MENKLKKNTALLKALDLEIVNFYRDWLHLQNADDLEASTNLLAHLAREILEGLRKIEVKKKRVPKDIERTWKGIVKCLEKFRHRHKVWNTPYKKEEFNEVWSEFQTLLVYIVECDFDSRSITDSCLFNTLQDSLIRLKVKLDKMPKTEWSISNIELSDPQSEINENLQTLAPLLAAFYRDWLKIRKSTNFKCRSYLLAHLAREIDGGFRGILSIDKDKKTIEQELETKGHIASIMSALGVHDSDLRSEQWIQTTKDLFILTHKNIGNKARSLRKESESLWPKFEELLAFLVGGYLNLLNRVDKILKAEQPNENMVGTLHDLLKPEVLNKYFFQNLKSSMWLKLLKENGWFNSENNPMPQEDPAHSGYYYTPRWYALEYVGKVADYTINHPCDETLDILVDIVNDIVKSAGDHRNRINNKWTDWQTIKIIGALPTDQIKCGHITFMGIALKSKWKSGLVDQEIGQTILPKLLNGGEQELTLALFTIMLRTGSVDGRSRPIMDEYWLEIALKAQAQAVANLCGIEAAQIGLEKIRAIAVANRFILDFIQRVESDLSHLSHPNYAELIVSFTSALFRFAEPDSIEQTVQVLLQDPHAIIRRIAVKAITDHYSNLKHLFWEWEGNPLDEIKLKPEMYQLIQTNSSTFDEDEMEQILQWIESTES